MDAIFQTAFWNGFSWMKFYEFRLKLLWSFFPGAQQFSSTGSVNGLAPSMRQAIIWTNDGWFLTHIWVTRPHWVKVHRPNIFLWNNQLFLHSYSQLWYDFISDYKDQRSLILIPIYAVGSAFKSSRYIPKTMVWYLVCLFHEHIYKIIVPLENENESGCSYSAAI